MIRVKDSPACNGDHSLKRSSSCIKKSIFRLFDPRLCGISGHIVTVHDYKSLAAAEYLNDAVVDFYLAHLYKKLSEPLKEAIHIFSSHFYTRLKG